MHVSGQEQLLDRHPAETGSKLWQHEPFTFKHLLDDSRAHRDIPLHLESLLVRRQQLYLTLQTKFIERTKSIEQSTAEQGSARPTQRAAPTTQPQRKSRSGEAPIRCRNRAARAAPDHRGLAHWLLARRRAARGRGPPVPRAQGTGRARRVSFVWG